MLIDKAAIPEIMVKSMHETHLREVDLINELYALIQQKRGGEQVDGQLDALVDKFEEEVEAHFRSEEELMLGKQFPGYPVHKGEHDRVLSHLGPLASAWRKGRDIEPLAGYLENEHMAWAENHISTMDAMTAYFIAKSKP